MHVPILALKMSRFLASAVHPAVILLSISLSWFFVSGGISLFQIGVAFKDLDLSVVDILALS